MGLCIFTLGITRRPAAETDEGGKAVEEPETQQLRPLVFTV